MLAQGAGKEACGYLMADYHEAIAQEVELRWTEEDEAFEEDIVPKEFCGKIGVCRDGQKTMNEIVSDSDRKEKDIKEDQEFNARWKKHKKKALEEEEPEEDD